MSSEEKTEEPTQQRRRDARDKGQIPYSAELAQGALMLAGILSLWMGVGVATGLQTSMKTGLTEIRSDLTADELPALGAAKLREFAFTIGPLLGIMIVTVIFAGMVQSGANISTTSLTPDLSRLSMLRGWNRIWSSRAVMKAFVSLVKVAAVALIAMYVIMGRFDMLSQTGRGPLITAIRTGWSTAAAVAIGVAGAMTIVGLIDYLYQRWKHEQDLRMSLQEVRDDHKQQDGDPMVRARIRKLQRERATGRMMRDVPDATVVITNPTHISVALKYDRATMTAPKVVAKGSGAVALRIRKIAAENDVPVIERKPVARALYASVEVGDEIPLELYHVVAEILSYIFGLRR